MIELYTPWCPSCRSMKPVVDELAARCRDGGVRIDAVDISREDNERLAEELGIGAVPTFVFLDAAGAETARLVGAQSAETLRRELVEAGGAACGGSISG